ncbi:alpha/beta fold hydrolase [Rubricoccus marinus]|uniref:AB hydrolase-1 domain-containing protein n=1 Tax=Rubricoccus marinus TaxID=716817 RepID=A0A259TUL7_9BACT|nr:alpha/beta fold hydrolase [Rubricoccus marinus]OZC01455.1 hypothetical protein BSZ36_17415 [Rubricoccus marinus]
MNHIADFPFFPLHVDRDAQLLKPEEEAAFLSHLNESHVQNLLVLSHGWNNDLEEARTLYSELLANLRATLEAEDTYALGGSTAVLGVYWPSKRFAPPSKISGGAASIGGDASSDDVQRALNTLADTLGPDAAEALRKAADLSLDLDERQVQNEFVDAIRKALPDSATEGSDPIPPRLRSASGFEVLGLLAPPPPPPPASGGTGGATSFSPLSVRDPSGGAAGIGDTLRGIRAAALRLANLTTYYTMKERAGNVGKHALAPVLNRLAAAHPALRIHLCGHSFGGRVVTAAASAVAEPVSSLVLLQAAFSHNGFSADFGTGKPGAFRNVLDDHKVSGSIVITHTSNDRAVGLAYPLASRLAGQAASSFGGPEDRFGGIGRNGAQRTDEAQHQRLLPTGQAYSFSEGGLYNLRADDHITDHSDVTGREVAAALVAAMGA